MKNKYALDKPIHNIILLLVINYNFLKYSPSSLASINNINSNISISQPREDVYVCLQNSYISVEFELFKNDDTRYVDSDQISLVNFGPVALFSEAKLVTS